MSGYELFADVSHWQGSVDFAKYPYKRIGLKCTDGANSVDPTYAQHVKGAHAAGLQVLHYCFAEPGDGARQARFLLDTVVWHSGDRLVIDAEVNGVNRLEVNDFISECHTLKPSAAGAVYGSPGFLNPRKIRPSHGWGLWEADYTDNPSPDTVAGWKSWTFWQFSQTSTVPGISGQCDLSRVAHPATMTPRGFTVLQRPIIRRATKILEDRTHPPTATALAKIDNLITAAEHAGKLK